MNISQNHENDHIIVRHRLRICQLTRQFHERLPPQSESKNTLFLLGSWEVVWNGSVVGFLWLFKGLTSLEVVGYSRPFVHGVFQTNSVIPTTVATSTTLPRKFQVLKRHILPSTLPTAIILAFCYENSDCLSRLSLVKFRSNIARKYWVKVFLNFLTFRLQGYCVTT